MLGSNNILLPSCLRCTVLRKERVSSQGRQRGSNKHTFIVEMPSTQYTSFSSRKQPANAGSERKQFTENASVALLSHFDQQTIFTHADTKCPPVTLLPSLWSSSICIVLMASIKFSIDCSLCPDSSGRGFRRLVKYL